MQLHHSLNSSCYHVYSLGLPPQLVHKRFALKSHRFIFISRSEKIMQLGVRKENIVDLVRSFIDGV
jgi:hypothetical protein